MKNTERPLTFDEAAFPDRGAVSMDIDTWHIAKIKAGLKQADEGRFATSEQVKAVIQKFIPNG
jgi:predicted transcriptional regulator